jgi:beta-glucosidase-like glycosyl hydrolase/CubicO group peptidase (beta-lactamase class C family)
VLIGLVFGMSAAPKKTYHIYDKNAWVDSVLSSMTLDEKIGQLFMVDAFSTKEKYNLPQLQNLVNDYKIGGIIFFKGSPYKQVEMTNQLQSISKLPLLIGMDAEWGLSMRLDSTIQYAYQMSMGALKEDSLIYLMGRDIARQCKRLGMQVNFAPDVDINNNPLNPVIHMRSFGENKYAVSRKALMYMQGMQDEHVLAVAKHFPGHGNTATDSHLDLPVLKQSKKELDTLELYPFRYMFANGVGSVMTAHLNIPAYDTTPNIGASLSPMVTTGLLRWDMKFRGLVFSDALNMKGVAKYFAPGELELKALLAGNDILLYSENVPKAITYIKKAIADGCLDEEFINEKVRRILAVKKWVGLDDCHYVDIKNVTEDLNTANQQLIKQHIAEKSVTLVKNDSNLIPLKNLQKYRIASVAIGTKGEMPFQDMMRNYCKADYFVAPMLSKDTTWDKLRDTLKNYNLVVISLHFLSNKNTATYGLSDRAIAFINEINKRQKVILVSIGSPYALSRFPDFKNVICGYQDEISFQYSAAQLLFGGIGSNARLPVGVTKEYGINSGQASIPIKMKYTMPEEAGLSSEKLEKIDSIVAFAIKAGAMPGCQIVVARHGNVIYNKSFGSPTYTATTKVENSNLYDLASVTKVAATTLVAMHLYENKKLDINAKLGTYLPELKGTDKADLSIKEIMSHQAGLIGWIPFYKSTILADGSLDTTIYSKYPTAEFNLPVANNLYIRQSYADTMYKIIDNSRLDNRGKYRYSDLGFLYMQRVIQKITGQRLDTLADSLFYKPLGLATMTYNPREKVSLSRIIPTEDDTYFRRQLVQGYVHDPAAALLGGVAGHAGLFSNANDLAIIMQMLVNNGVYGGKRYFTPATIKLFTSAQGSNSRRGLGWDKPALDPKLGSPASKYASQMSFGHTGFTGTCIWADPTKDLVYIFLSNRVYPTAENAKLAHLNIRTDIHDAIYEAIVK